VRHRTRGTTHSKSLRRASFLSLLQGSVNRDLHKDRLCVNDAAASGVSSRKTVLRRNREKLLPGVRRLGEFHERFERGHPNDVDETILLARWRRRWRLDREQRRWRLRRSLPAQRLGRSRPAQTKRSRPGERLGRSRPTHTQGNRRPFAPLPAASTSRSRLHAREA